jgi:hypothetical protein
MTTTSAANASQMIQFVTAAAVRHGSPVADCSSAMTGMTRSAATRIGTSKARSIRSLRSSLRRRFDASEAAPSLGRR